MWEITLSLASGSRIYKPILFSFIAHGFLCAIGILTIFLYPQLSSWGFFVGMGFVFFGAGSFIHSLFYIFRVFNAAKTETYILKIEKA